MSTHYSPLKSHIQHPRRLKAMKIRAEVETGIRSFFQERGFLETRTPLIVPSPGMETHIRTYQVVPTSGPNKQERQVGYLPTSPEFAMKRLLVGGLERIFQITPAFRDEPQSPHHRSEFTMLEWYRANSNLESIFEDTENLVETLCRKIHGTPQLNFGSQKISVQAPWVRFKVRDLFLKYAHFDLRECTTIQAIREQCKALNVPIPSDAVSPSWDDYYFSIWLNYIEPQLPKDRAFFVTHYPRSQAALAVIQNDDAGFPWAQRFEAYLGGIELCNAFEELTDPIEQKARFERDMQLRSQVYGDDFPPTPIDPQFIAALEEGLPPSGGIALGVDRLVMLLANEPEIDYTFWL